MSTTTRMPALFLAHGSPMNAIEDNEFTRALSALPANLPEPKAILMVSAHWLTDTPRVSTLDAPRTIHDFGGFPDELYEIQYPAPGAPELAARVAELLPGVLLDESWGLDHGAWTVLRHMWPDANIPVTQLSVAAGGDPQFHLELGRALAPLRDEGVLIIGSGNIVHSFAGIDWSPHPRAHLWALEFDVWVAEALVRGDDEALVEYHRAGPAAQLSVPSNDHYLPLLYATGARLDGDAVTFPHTGIDMASMSMRCVQFG